jgi:hypothetical protein
MYGFDQDGDTFSLIKFYLQHFVATHIDNPDPEIAAAVGHIQQILQDSEADLVLQASLDAIKGISDATQEFLALPYIATGFVKWFSARYPRFSAGANYFGSVLTGGLAGFAAMSLVTQFKSWSRMSDEEKAQVVTNTVQLGIQFLAAMVKRGVRISKIFAVDGLSGGQRAASVFKILANGEGGELEAGLVRTGNSTARWLSSAQGSAEIDVSADGVMNAVLINDAESAAEDAGLVGKLLGKKSRRVHRDQTWTGVHPRGDWLQHRLDREGGGGPRPRRGHPGAGERSVVAVRAHGRLGGGRVAGPFGPRASARCGRGAQSRSSGSVRGATRRVPVQSER